MRLIDADEIVKVAEHAFNEWNLAMAAADGRREINHTYKMQELCKAVKAVADAAPTIEAEPVKRGRWLQPKSGECFCSECQTNGSPQWKRCPVCEAKMDGGDVQ